VTDLPPTPSQTVGPYFSIGLPWPRGETLVTAETLGERITVRGRVLDGDGAAINDALLEIWQANAAGRYAHEADRRDDLPLDPAFLGFGRCATDDEGRYVFHTIRPGRVPGPNGTLQAPHLAVSVLARGLLKRLATRIYFDDAPGNGEDPILALVEAPRRERLIARREPGEQAAYAFDVVLQGEDESVFFAF
jgi:protocatechuate 3,4-dioxygenase alpha subunit